MDRYFFRVRLSDRGRKSPWFCVEAACSDVDNAEHADAVFEQAENQARIAVACKPGFESFDPNACDIEMAGVLCIDGRQP